jgi:hypothetical protein
LIPVGGEEEVRKECKRVNMVQILGTHEKQIPVATIPRMGEGGIKENGRGWRG